MYPIAFRIFLALLPLLVMVAAMFEAATRFLDANMIGANLVVGAFLALIFHRAILLGELDVWRRPKDTDAAELPIMRFFGRFLLFLLPMAVVFLAAVIVAWPEFEDPTGAVLLALIPAVLLFPFWGGWAGTMLPAAAVGGDPTLAAAFQRGRSSYWKTVGRLFAGPILFPLAAIALSLVLAALVPPLFAAEPVWLALAVNTVFATLGYGTPLLTATALSMAYQEAEGLA